MEKEAIRSMDSENFDLAGNEELSDEFGNPIPATQKGKQPKEEDSLDDKSKEGEQGEDDDELQEFTGLPKRAYERLKKLNLENKELKSLKENVPALERDAQAFRELMKDQEFVKVLGQFLGGVAPREEKQQEEAPSLENLSIEKMSDKEIGETIARYAAGMNKGEISSLKSEIEALKKTIGQLGGKLQDGEVKGFIADEENFPGAKENQAAIKDKMNRYGATFEEAYYMTMGKKLKDMGFQSGMKRMKEKQGKETHAFGKRPSPVSDGSKRYKNIREAFDAARAESGLD